MKLNWNFLGGRGGGGGGQNNETFCGGSMDIFWNCTMQAKVIFTFMAVFQHFE